MFLVYSLKSLCLKYIPLICIIFWHICILHFKELTCTFILDHSLFVKVLDFLWFYQLRRNCYKFGKIKSVLLETYLFCQHNTFSDHLNTDFLLIADQIIRCSFIWIFRCTCEYKRQSLSFFFLLLLFLKHLFI